MATYNLVQCVFDRSALRPDEDDAAITMHIRQVVEAAPDFLPVTDEGRDDFVQRLLQWWVTTQPFVDVNTVFKEARFYDVPDGGPFPNKDPRSWMGDPVLIH